MEKNRFVSRIVTLALLGCALVSSSSIASPVTVGAQIKTINTTTFNSQDFCVVQIEPGIDASVMWPQLPAGTTNYNAIGFVIDGSPIQDFWLALFLHEASTTGANLNITFESSIGLQYGPSQQNYCFKLLSVQLNTTVANHN